MTICTFFGHREVYQSGIAARLETEIEKLLQTDHKFVFLTGGMGQFDDIAASAVRAAKYRHPEKRITLALVLPYLSNRLNKDKEYYQASYDEIIIPDEVNTAHYKAAIQIRNRWMVDRADSIISCICRDFGGAFTAVRYAQRQGKPVINLVERKEKRTSD